MGGAEALLVTGSRRDPAGVERGDRRIESSSRADSEVSLCGCTARTCGFVAYKYEKRHKARKLARLSREVREMGFRMTEMPESEAVGEAA